MAVADQRQNRLGMRIRTREPCVAKHGFAALTQALDREQWAFARHAVEQAGVLACRRPDRVLRIG